MKSDKPDPSPISKPYLVVTDKDSIVVFSGSYNEACKKANFARKCGGEVTIFKATKG